MKTVRFTKIVEEAGTPEPYTLWLPPEKDPQFQSALKAHRIMTVHQANIGTGTDFGEIGFAKGAQGSFLLFPKSLKKYEGHRVVGVKYDLLKETPPEISAPKKREPKASAPTPQLKQKPRARQKAAAAAPPKFEPLKVFEPEEAKKPERPARAGSEDYGGRLDALLREVRKAMKKLEKGNAVAAYQILEKAISPP